MHMQRQELEMTGNDVLTIDDIGEDSLNRDIPMSLSTKFRHCFYPTFVELKAEDREAAGKFLKNQQKLKSSVAEKKLSSPYYDYSKSSASESKDQIRVQEDRRQRRRLPHPPRRSDMSPSEIYAQFLNYNRKTSLQSDASGDCLEKPENVLTPEILVLKETNKVVSPSEDTVSPQSRFSGKKFLRT